MQLVLVVGSVMHSGLWDEAFSRMTNSVHRLFVRSCARQEIQDMCQCEPACVSMQRNKLPGNYHVFDHIKQVLQDFAGNFCGLKCLICHLPFSQNVLIKLFKEMILTVHYLTSPSVQRCKHHSHKNAHRITGKSDLAKCTAKMYLSLLSHRPVKSNE